MQAIFAVTLPFFALVLCGYLAAQRHVLPASAIPGLNAFVLFFALPCLLFRFGQSTPLLQLLNPAVLGVYVLAALIIVFFTVAVTLSARLNLKDSAFGALVAAFPNSGFMGVPLLVALLGPAAAGPVICTVLADMLITSSLCLGLAQAAGAGAGGGRAAAARALRGALSNPLPWAIVLGAAAGVTQVQLPAPVQTIVKMLADAASPVALFTIGAVLWRSRDPTHRSTDLDDGTPPPATAPLRQVAPIAAIKLLLHPLLVLLLGAGAREVGAPLSSFQLMALTLTAALPSASNVSLLAERYGADNGRVARIIMASTASAFVTFSAAAWLFGIKPQG
ncbi:MAG TPA: AEC family transporter [Ideonella sp.]|uniref:AEC family transporter n=1 Tax=Ideonella sp. TaxID=1929293 RepID=UPI002E346B10|nr:AEC family transporter [Ideonella sp.]HEX5687268.1 AEC family transporter [Ideonella sp.]